MEGDGDACVVGVAVVGVASEEWGEEGTTCCGVSSRCSARMWTCSGVSMESRWMRGVSSGVLWEETAVRASVLWVFPLVPFCMATVGAEALQEAAREEASFGVVGNSTARSWSMFTDWLLI